MRQTVRWLAAVTALTAALGLAPPLGASPDEPKIPGRPSVGDVAPEFDVHDWIDGDGRTSVAQFRGEVLFLVFWGTH